MDIGGGHLLKLWKVVGGVYMGHLPKVCEMVGAFTGGVVNKKV